MPVEPRPRGYDPDLAEHIDDLHEGIVSRWDGDASKGSTIVANVLWRLIADTIVPDCDLQPELTTCPRCAGRLLNAAFDAAYEAMFDRMIQIAHQRGVG